MFFDSDSGVETSAVHVCAFGFIIIARLFPKIVVEFQGQKLPNAVFGAKTDAKLSAR